MQGLSANGIWFALAALALLGCSATPMPASYRAALAHERARDPARALAAYRIAEKRCPDQKACGAIGLRIAAIEVDLGRFSTALQSYLRLANDRYRHTTRARALYRAGRLLELRLKQPVSAMQRYQQAIACCEQEVAAADALRALLRMWRIRKQDQLALRELITLYPRVQNSFLGDDVLYQAALIYQRRGYSLRAARLFDELVNRYPRSPLRPRCLFLSARIFEQKNRPEQAITRYRRIVKRRRYPSFGPGSYNSPYMDDAQLAVAMLYLHKLDRPRDALRELRLLRDDFRDSRLRDDAQWHIAMIHRKAGRTQRACRSLAQLLSRYPNGNHARRAKIMQTRWSCLQKKRK
jgi:TolA-binding protein